MHTIYTSIGTHEYEAPVNMIHIQTYQNGSGHEGLVSGNVRQIHKCRGLQQTLM